MVSVGITEGDVDTGNLLVLQNVADNVGAGGVGADCEFTDAVAVLIGARVETEFLEQFLVLADKIDNAIVAHFNGERRGAEIPVLCAEIISDDTINDKAPVRVERRCKNFATRQVAP